MHNVQRALLGVAQPFARAAAPDSELAVLAHCLSYRAGGQGIRGGNGTDSLRGGTQPCDISLSQSDGRLASLCFAVAFRSFATERVDCLSS